MSGWMMAMGRDAQQTLTAGAAAGARSVTLAGADALFAARERLFISQADGSQAEWLGRVTAVSATALSFSRPIKTVKGAGALLWRAAAAIEFEESSAQCRRRVITTGVVTERSLGGDFYTIQLGPQQTADELRFTGLSDRQEEALLDWIATALAWGLEPFTLIEPGQAPRAVRLTGEAIQRQRDSTGQETLTLALVTEAEGAYA